MSDKDVLDYTNSVVSGIAAPDEFKENLKNELIRYIGKAFENKSIYEIRNNLGSPERLADEISYKLVESVTRDFGSIINKSNKHYAEGTKTSMKSPKKRNSKIPYGEFTHEESDVNIKLLYIPLLQISSGSNKIHYYLTEDDECETD
jgi:hypothetical protein